MKTIIQTPNWLDTQLYPFKTKSFNLPKGQINYIDEGEGEVILFVHGTPAWSFLYRDFIKRLSSNNRCIALDHLGFGLSDKPKDFDGTPQSHAANLTALIEHLDLKNITLVVHDFGGPIGLSYAIEHPENVKQIVLFNTWLWATAEDPAAQKVDRILHSTMGNFIYLNTNFSPRVLLKNAFHNKKKLSKTAHQHYRKPFPNKNSRYGLLNIGKALIGSSDWYGELWQKVDRIKDKPFLVLWGAEDPFIGQTHFEKWTSTLTNAAVHTFKAGHFVQEEATEECIDLIDDFVKG